MSMEAVILVNREGEIQFWSEGATHMFGHRAHEVVGRPVDVIVPEELRAAHWRGFRSAIENGSIAADGAAFDAPALCRDGTVVTFRGQIRLLKTERKVLGAVAVFERR
jgi:PAS domain S-box-containing protein